MSIEEQRKFFDMLNDLSGYLGYKINVVIHPITASNVKESIEKTIEYVDELIKISDLDKIIISLENLNDIKSEDRLNKDDIIPIVANNENLYFTYDIGHEISNYGSILIDKNLISTISNIHIHTMDFNYSNGFDHKPILKNDKYWNDILKGLLFLKIIIIVGMLFLNMIYMHVLEKI